MHFINNFSFSQSDIQNDGGWCNGLALLLSYILTHGGLLPAPNEAFDLANALCTELKHSFPCAKGATPAATDQLLLGAHTLCGYASGPDLPNFTNKFVYNFASPGIAMLQLNVTSDTKITVYGGAFQWRMATSFLADTNHAGVVVWDNDTIFLFDPNVGGVLFQYPKSWSWSSLLRYSVPAAIDEALEKMYRKSNARNAIRRCRVVCAVHVDPATFASALRTCMKQDPNPSKMALVGLKSLMIETPKGLRRLQSWMTQIEPAVNRLSDASDAV
jgi:hypothetical protein